MIGVITVFVRHPDAVPGSVTPFLAMVAGGVTCVALAGRRLWPRATGAVVIVGTGATVVVAHGAPVFTIAMVLALYTIAVRTDRRTTVHAFVAATAVFLASVAVVSAGRDARFVVDAVSGLLAWTAIAAAFGDVVRSRRAYLSATEERAERAERTREEEARRRVVEERLRIAQELHDVVAHNVAVVSVQAGLADHLFLKQPDAARQALHQVQRASATIPAPPSSTSSLGSSTSSAILTTGTRRAHRLPACTWRRTQRQCRNRCAATSGTRRWPNAECTLSQKLRGSTARPSDGKNLTLLAKPE